MIDDVSVRLGLEINFQGGEQKKWCVVFGCILCVYAIWRVIVLTTLALV